MKENSEDVSQSLPTSLSMADLEFLITSKSSPNVTRSNYDSRGSHRNNVPPPELQQIIDMYAGSKEKIEEIKQNISVESKIK